MDGGEELFTPLACAARRARAYRTRPEFVRRLLDDIDFPIDAVYTWVDGADPAWRARRDQAERDEALRTGTPPSEMATTEARFTSRDELRYSLRSLLMYAPWINRIWIVTDGQTPPWLDTTHPMVSVVDHKEIFTDPSVLPVFNSHAIETQLHHIDGLSEHFLYFNDDFFLGRPLPPRTFFEGNGITRFFPSTVHVPFGMPETEESPVHAAGMNNRRILENLTGRTITQKLKHVPYALRRSLMYELEGRFAAEFTATARSRFRTSRDISVVSSLAHYYGYLSGRAVPGTVDYTYVDLSLPKTPAKLRRMLARRRHDVFCLNRHRPHHPRPGRAAGAVPGGLLPHPGAVRAVSVPQVVPVHEQAAEGPAAGGGERTGDQSTAAGGHRVLARVADDPERAQPVEPGGEHPGAHLAARKAAVLLW
ncbi:hypothetical protein B1L11_29475 [Microbispora sp. GKU 823]|nr:stealth conserved region 3 domain-containing protein [Microbispora sp. GKU 823]OPG07884.1 hypothetical protein B1L11_29475 [Microbispora sp. GKU 823]